MVAFALVLLAVLVVGLVVGYVLGRSLTRGEVWEWPVVEPAPDRATLEGEV